MHLTGRHGGLGQDFGQQSGWQYIFALATPKHAQMQSPAPGEHTTTLTYSTTTAAVAAAAHPCRWARR
jgi:hypothetical protein